MLKLEEKDLLEYLKIVRKCFHEKAPEIIKDELEAGSLKDIVFYHKNNRLIGGVTLQNLGAEIYGIRYTAIEPEFQRQGYGKKLMEKVHGLHKGIFLLRTRATEKFYKEFGYVSFKKTQTHTYMIFINKEARSF